MKQSCCVKRKSLFFPLMLFSLLPLLWVGCGGAAKIAFFVKDPTDSWFQDEWVWAKKASENYGFKLLTFPKEGVKNYTNQGVLEDLKAAQKEKIDGAIFCLPDILNAQPIIDFCAQNHIKMMTVDDRIKMYDPKTKSYVFNETVPHLGIDSYKTGRLVGISLAQDLVQNGVREKSLGVLRLINPSNKDLLSRVDGAAYMLEEVLGFNSRRFITLAPKSLDANSVSEVISRRFPDIYKRNPQIKDWVVISFNDDCTIAGVEYLNRFGISPRHIYAYGINGSKAALETVAKRIGFRGTIQLRSDIHGYDTCKYMYQWISANKEPEKVLTSMGNLITAADLKK